MARYDMEHGYALVHGRLYGPKGNLIDDKPLVCSIQHTIANHRERVLYWPSYPPTQAYPRAKKDPPKRAKGSSSYVF